MDKVYEHKDVEEKLYKMWEENGYFKPEINPKGKPYCIILPPPNANGDLHFGHAMFTIEDILIRYHRMKGDAALWLPGTDHAGTETQFVFEKKLQEQGKSRFDYNREDLYKHIWEYVQKNRGGIENQLRRLGFSLDWSREKFTLDSDIVELVKKTFQKMYEDKLVYRDYRLVNYCTRDGTSFSDLEVVSQESPGILYIIHYPLKNGSVLKGVHDMYIPIATTRPETLFGDTAIMVHPEDARYKHLIGRTAIVPFINREIPIIADAYVDKSFGTGAVKVTPAHDFNDFEIGKSHNLLMKQIIGFNGKMMNTGLVDGLYVKQARPIVIEELQKLELIGEVTSHHMVIKKCYKCNTILEPLPLEQWYVNVQPLISNALKSVDNGFTKVYPDNFIHILKQWYANLRDWNISRQNVWGIQIPVWYDVTGHEKEFSVSFIDGKNKPQKGYLATLLKEGFTWEEILAGLQSVRAPITAKVIFAEDKKEHGNYLPETDTFDTWFSSGQWPYVTLKTAEKGDFEKFYPTAVMETGYDILKSWISRMLMLGLYVANGKQEESLEKIKKTVPFQDVVLHGLVNDPLGKKMSKSKGNVVNPLEVADQYGADAVRFALVYGTALGNDQAMSYPKLEAARKFTNKLWNMARFITMKNQELGITNPNFAEASLGKQEFKNLDNLVGLATHENDKMWVEKVEKMSQEVSKYIDNYQFNLAAERLYEFVWHEFADKYIEDVKNRMTENSSLILNSLFLIQLKLLHPFMPFITEKIYQKLSRHKPSIMLETWPTK